MTPNLLITDDDSAFRAVLCEGLSRRGFRVTEASDGEEAIEKIERYEVHLAVVDVHMPRVTGLDVIRHVSKIAGPPCVLMSAQLDDEIRREAARMKAYQVLSKPIRLAQLTDLVCGALADVYDWRPAG